MAPSPTKFKASDLLTREGLERLAKQSLSWLRDYLTAIKSGQLHPFTQIERKTREATRDEPWYADRHPVSTYRLTGWSPARAARQAPNARQRPQCLCDVESIAGLCCRLASRGVLLRLGEA